MAFDGSIRVDTTLNLDDFKKKLDEAKKKADELAKPFDNVTKEIQKTEQALAKAESRFAEIQKQLSPIEAQKLINTEGFEAAQRYFETIGRESDKLQTQIIGLKQTLKGLVVEKGKVETPFKSATQELEEYIRQYQARIEDEKRLAAESAATKIKADEEYINFWQNALAEEDRKKTELFQRLTSAAKEEATKRISAEQDYVTWWENAVSREETERINSAQRISSALQSELANRQSAEQEYVNWWESSLSERERLERETETLEAARQKTELLEKQRQEVEELMASYSQIGRESVLSFKQAESGINRTRAAISKIENQQRDLATAYYEANKEAGISKEALANIIQSDETYQRLQSRLEKLNKELRYYELQQSAASASTEKISGATSSQVSAINNAASAIKKFGSNVKKAFSGALGAVANFGRATGQALGNAVKSTGRFLKNLFNMNSGMKNTRRQSGLLSGAFSQLTKRLLRLAVGALIFNQIGKQIRNLISYYNEANKTNAEFVASISLLKGSWLTAFQPLYEFVLPVLITFINLLAKAGQYLAAFTSALFGVDPSKMQDNAKAMWDNVNALRKGSKEAKRFLAPFDEIITVGEQASDTDMNKIVPDFDWEVPDISWLDTFIEKLKTIHKELDLDFYYEVGEEFGKNIATKLTDALNNIPWENIQTASKNIAAGIAGLINGFVKVTDWSVVGKTLGEAINTAVGFAETLFDKTNFYKIGEAIATTLNSTINTIDWINLGETVGKGINSIFDTMRGFVDKFDFENLGLKLSEGLTSMTDTIQWEYIGETLGLGLNGALTTLHTFLEEYDFTKLGGQVASLLNKMIETVDATLLGQTIADIINSAFDFLGVFIDEFDFENLGLKMSEALTGLTDHIKWEDIGDTLGSGITGALNTIYTFLTTYDFEKLGGQVASLLNKMITEIDWGLLGQTIGSLFNSIIDSLYGFITKFDWKKLGSSLSNAINGFFDEVDWAKAGELVSEGIKGTLNFINTALKETDWNKFGEAIGEFLGNIDWVGIFQKLIETVARLVIANVNFIDGFAKGFSQAIGDALGLEMEGVGKFIVDGLEIGIKAAFAAFNPIYWFKVFIDAIKKLFGIQSPSTVMEEIGVNLIKGLLNGIKSLVQDIIDFFNELLTNIHDIFKDIGKWFSDRWEDIKTSFNTVGTWFKTTFDTAWTNVKNVWQNVGTWFTNTVWGGIKGAFSNITEWFRTKFTDAWTAVKNVFSKGGEIFLGIQDGILSGLKIVINGLIDGINKVIKIPLDGINEALKAIKNVDIAGFKPFSWLPTITVPQIPRLARGGIVDRAMIAQIGERGREAVIPLDRDTRALDEIANRIAERIGNQNNSETNALLRQLIELTKSGHKITMNDRVVAQTTTNAQRSLQRQLGETLLQT